MTSGGINYYIELDRDDPYHKGNWFLGQADVNYDINKYGEFLYDETTKTITLRSSNFNTGNEGLGDIVKTATHTNTLPHTHFGLLYGYCHNRGSRLGYSTGGLTNTFHADVAENGKQIGTWSFDYLNLNLGRITIKDTAGATTFILTPDNFEDIIFDEVGDEEVDFTSYVSTYPEIFKKI